MEPRDIVENEYKKIHNTYENKKVEWEHAGFLVLELEEMTKGRLKHFVELRAYMCRKVKTSFTEHLSKRNFNGLLKFNHQEVSSPLLFLP